MTCPELKESLSRMGSDIKHGFISSLKSAWQTLNEFARAHTSSAQLHEQLAMVASQIKAEEEKQQGEGKLTTVNILLPFHFIISPGYCAHFSSSSIKICISLFVCRGDGWESWAPEGRGDTNKSGHAEWRESHRLRPARETHRELQWISVCTPKSSVLLVCDLP